MRRLIQLSKLQVPANFDISCRSQGVTIVTAPVEVGWFFPMIHHGLGQHPRDLGHQQQWVPSPACNCASCTIAPNSSSGPPPRKKTCQHNHIKTGGIWWYSPGRVARFSLWPIFRSCLSLPAYRRWSQQEMDRQRCRGWETRHGLPVLRPMWLEFQDISTFETAKLFKCIWEYLTSGAVVENSFPAKSAVTFVVPSHSFG